MTPQQTLQKALVRAYNKIPTVYATRRNTTGGQGHKAFELKLLKAISTGQKFTLYINKSNPDLAKFLAVVEQANARNVYVTVNYFANPI